MEKKTIVIFTNTLLSGGAEKQALLLAKTLNHTFNVFLVVYYGKEIESKYSALIFENNIKLLKLDGNHAFKAYKFYKFLKSHKVQFIFSYLLTTNLIGAIIGKLAGVPERVGGIRNAFLDKQKLEIQRFIHNHLSTRTIFNNYKGITLLVKQGFNKDKAFVITNCFELNQQPVERENKATVNIITVGRFVAQKGYENGLEAMKLLKDSGLDFKYFIVGYGPLENKIRGIIEEAKLTDHVEVIKNPPNINEYYLKSDIYLCSSIFEGLSNTVLEALSFSLPVVATDAGDNRLLVNEGFNGFVVQKSNAELFVRPLAKLIASHTLRAKMGRHSFNVLKQNYGTEAFRENYIHFINTHSN